MGRLPHMLDGTTDGQRPSAKKLLSVAGKIRSPPLIHRPSPTRGVWLGPHAREVLNNAAGGDDVFRSGARNIEST